MKLICNRLGSVDRAPGTVIDLIDTVEHDGHVLVAVVRQKAFGKNTDYQRQADC